MSREILIPVAFGELIDKITILEIKTERIGDPARLQNVTAELAALRSVASAAGIDHPAMIADLKALNAAIWDDEEMLRAFGAKGNFGPGFAAAASRIYQNNDRRFATKRLINTIFGSSVIEEKSY